MGRRHSFKLFSGITVSAFPGWGWKAASRNRIAVAGGGIVGSSIAYHLACRGAQVFLLEKARPASGATGNSFAWINANYDKQPRHYNDLNQLGMLAYRQLEEELEGNLQVQWGGGLSWTEDRQRSRTLKRSVKKHQEWGYSTQLIDEKMFKKLEPNIVPGLVLAAAYAKEEGSVNPKDANQSLLEKACQLGAQVEYPCEVTGLDIRSGRLHGVKTTQGDFETDVLVIACGVDTPGLAQMAGIDVPLVKSPGLLAYTKPTSRILQRVVRAPGVEMKQQLDGRIVTGAGDGGNLVSEKSDEEGEKALARAAPFVPQLKNTELEQVTVGWRPLPRDRHPVLGFAECCPDIYLAVMHSGVTLSPIVGRLAALEILDDVRVEMLEYYRVARFST